MPAGPVSKPLRHNRQPYSGINILMLWASAMEKGYSVPIWMTFRQASVLGAHVRKDEKGALVVNANTITRTEMDEQSGEEVEQPTNVDVDQITARRPALFHDPYRRPWNQPSRQRPIPGRPCDDAREGTEERPPRNSGRRHSCDEFVQLGRKRCRRIDWQVA